MQLATPPYSNLKNVINHSSLFERSLYYRKHGAMSSSEILRSAPGDLLWSVHPVYSVLFYFQGENCAL